MKAIFLLLILAGFSFQSLICAPINRVESLEERRVLKNPDGELLKQSINSDTSPSIDALQEAAGSLGEAILKKEQNKMAVKRDPWRRWIKNRKRRPIRRRRRKKQKSNRGRKADRVKPSNTTTTTTPPTAAVQGDSVDSVAPAVKTERPATSTTHPSTNQNEPTTQTAPIGTVYDQVSTVASTKAGEEGTQERNPITDQSLLWMTLCPKYQMSLIPSTPPSPTMFLKRGGLSTEPPSNIPKIPICYGYYPYG